MAIKMPDQDLYRSEAKKAPSPTGMQLGSFKGRLLPYVHLAANLSQTPQALSPGKVPALWSPPAGALSVSSLLSAVLLVFYPNPVPPTSSSSSHAFPLL